MYQNHIYVRSVYEIWIICSFLFILWDCSICFIFQEHHFFFPLSNLGSLVWCWIEVITVGILILIFRRTLLTLTIRLGLCSRFFTVTFINVFPSLFFNLQWVLNFVEFFCIYLLRWLHGVLEWHQRNRTDRIYSWYF